MAKIKLTCSRVTADHVSQLPGDEIEVSDDEAARMIEAKQATAVAAAKKAKPVKKTKAAKS